LTSSHFLFDIRSFQWKGFQDRASYNYQTDLSTDFNELNQYRSSTRRQIKKCIRTGLVVKTGVLPDHFHDLWYSTHMVKGRKTAFSEGQIVSFIQSLSNTGLAEIYGVFDENGKVHAAALISRDETAGYYLMGGSDVKLRKSGAASLLHHEIMVDLKNRKLSYYDWFGGNTPEIVRFKIGFNPTLRVMTKISYSGRRAGFYKWVQDGKDYLLKKN
jgi:lipid II:glycine glycyltransferase (peptidoglycan interpeptide bridge formation enzyme)